MSDLKSAGEEGQFDWKCEFCSQTNKGINLEAGEVPKNDIVDCILKLITIVIIYI